MSVFFIFLLGIIMPCAPAFAYSAPSKNNISPETNIRPYRRGAITAQCSISSIWETPAGVSAKGIRDSARPIVEQLRQCQISGKHYLEQQYRESNEQYINYVIEDAKNAIAALKEYVKYQKPTKHECLDQNVVSSCSFKRWMVNTAEETTDMFEYLISIGKFAWLRESYIKAIDEESAESAKLAQAVQERKNREQYFTEHLRASADTALKQLSAFDSFNIKEITVSPNWYIYTGTDANGDPVREKADIGDAIPFEIKMTNGKETRNIAVLYDPNSVAKFYEWNDKRRPGIPIGVMDRGGEFLTDKAVGYNFSTFGGLSAKLYAVERNAEGKVTTKYPLMDIPIQPPAIIQWGAKQMRAAANKFETLAGMAVNGSYVAIAKLTPWDEGPALDIAKEALAANGRQFIGLPPTSGINQNLAAGNTKYLIPGIVGNTVDQMMGMSANMLGTRMLYTAFENGIFSRAIEMFQTGYNKVKESINSIPNSLPQLQAARTPALTAGSGSGDTSLPIVSSVKPMPGIASDINVSPIPTMGPILASEEPPLGISGPNTTTTIDDSIIPHPPQISPMLRWKQIDAMELNPETLLRETENRNKTTQQLIDRQWQRFFQSDNLSLQSKKQIAEIIIEKYPKIETMPQFNGYVETMVETMNGLATDTWVFKDAETGQTIQEIIMSDPVYTDYLNPNKRMEKLLEHPVFNRNLTFPSENGENREQQFVVSAFNLIAGNARDRAHSYLKQSITLKNLGIEVDDDFPQLMFDYLEQSDAGTYIPNLIRVNIRTIEKFLQEYKISFRETLTDQNILQLVFLEGPIFHTIIHEYIHHLQYIDGVKRGYNNASPNMEKEHMSILIGHIMEFEMSKNDEFINPDDINAGVNISYRDLDNTACPEQYGTFHTRIMNKANKIVKDINNGIDPMDNSPLRKAREQTDIHLLSRMLEDYLQ